ncbi:MAG: DUF4330 family protein [Clostridia bacterium]|nr:DUF4330 family protein [Clostridia bacterium]
MANKQSRVDRIAVTCINAFFVFLFIALACVLFYAAKPRGILRPDTTLTYTVTFKTIRTEYTADIHEGDTVLDAVGKREIGRVVSYTVAPAMTETYSRRENRLRTVQYPEHVTLTLTVHANANREGVGYSISGFSLIGGKKIPLRLPNFVGTGVCTAITEIA